MFDLKSRATSHKSRAARCGFTLIEMLVVIGIIAVLMGALAIGFSRFTKSATKATDQELVSNVAGALELVFRQNDGRWPKSLLNSDRLDANTAKGLVKYKKSANGSYTLVYNPLGLTHDQKSALVSGQVTLTGANKYGIQSAKGSKLVKADGSALDGYLEHTLRFAVDEDGDGITEVKADSGNVRVRATAAVWTANDYGVVVLNGRGTGENAPSVKSWAVDQQVE